MKLPVANGRVIMTNLARLMREHSRLLTLVVVLQIGATLTAVGLPWILGVVIDRVTAGEGHDLVAWALGGALALVAAGAVMAYFAEYYSRILGETVFARLREDLVDTVTRLPLSVVEEAGTGDLVGRTTRDVEQVQFLVRQGVSSIMVAVTTIAVTLVAAFLVSPVLALMLLLPFPPVVLIMRWYLPRTVPAYRAMASGWARVAGGLTESMENAETTDAFNLTDQRVRRIDNAFREMWRLERYTAWQRMFLLFGLVLVVTMPVVAVIMLGAWLLPAGTVTEGQISTVAIYAFQMRGPIWELTFWTDHVQSAAAAMGRIFGVSLVEGDRHPTGEQPEGNTLAANDVSYAYRTGQNVLHGVNLELSQGERLAIVGPSGAGKSTLGRMLAGIHPPGGGRVTVGDVNLVDLPERDLRSQVVLVSQEHHVFAGTVADNLRLAFEGATEQQVTDALTATGAMAWVDGLAEGINTPVGAGGVALTPAQAQQVALARIVLMDPHTLVLDEATSLLDPTAARSLERSLGQVLQGRTVVAIAHRLYTAADADRVAVMEDGRITELGAHPDLLSQEGQYAALWQSWQKS